MKKVIWIILGIIIVILIIGGVVVYNLFFKTSTDTASLKSFTGTVQINRSDKLFLAENDLKLKENDIVVTKQASTADIILYDSVYVQVEENTEISIEKLKTNNVKLKQTTGSTWTKFLNVVGIGKFEFETPSAVATIRGTEFGVDINDEEIISLLEGDLEILFDGQTHKLNPFFKFKIKNGKYEISEFTLEDKMRAVVKMRKSLVTLKNIRAKELNSRKSIIDQVIQKYNLTKGLNDYLEDIDSGRINDRNLVQYSPIITPVIDKLLKINDEIKKINWLIKTIEIGKNSEEIVQGLLNKDYLKFN